MKYYVNELFTDEYYNKIAGNKARKDIGTILSNDGFKNIDIEMTSNINEVRQKNKIKGHIDSYYYWKNKLSSLQNNDVLILQLPILYHSIFFGLIIKSLKKRGIKTISVIHDLDMIRYRKSDNALIKKIRTYLEERAIVKNIDVLISHNHYMSEVLKNIIPQSNIIDLEIFDYLTNAAYNNSKDKSIIVAGNLEESKSGYIYKIPSNVLVNAYGVNFQNDINHTIKYCGSYTPEELPSKMNGMYGLVWDGNSVDTCAGPTGEYLKINNPHKTSLYLASGIPVIIWKDAALADFLISNKCGVTIEKISDLPKVLNSLSKNEYLELKENAIVVGTKLRDGCYTKKAISHAFSILEIE